MNSRITSRSTTETRDSNLEAHNGLDPVDGLTEHVTHDTLLTQEEITLYSKLESSGALRNILSSPEIDSTRPFLDHDLRKAIETLNASTAAIQRQTEILTSQCENLNRQISLEDEREGIQSRDLRRLRQKHESGRQNTAAASSDLARDVESRLKSESDKVTMEGKRILSSLAGRLKEDDRVLADLERLASGIESTSDDASIIKKTSNFGTLLSQLVSEEIQVRLDRLYLESLQTSLGDTSFGSSEAHEGEALVALEGEMESLYPEIDILAEVSTKQQFSEPVLRELQHHHGQLRMASHNRLDYILDIVTEMALSTESLTKALKDRESFCGALESFASTYRTEIGDQFLEQSSARRETLRRRSTQVVPTPFSENHIAAHPESQTLASLLRRVGLSFESVFQSEEEDGGVHALSDKREDMVECLRNYGIAADSPLIAEALSTDQAGRLLSSSLHATSNSEVSLSDMDHDRKLTDLESQLGLIQKGIERLDLDAVYRRDKNQEKFMERWS
ncbi:hypothetical protein FE257_003457 [Aspergillus nanangensis]|uniref:Uncharacterized protein n=1 Tax=Aspergillus nanangensis TaxID=2582783 RepID=A0AAD4CBL4_ASPNN|nr:hypothetical protein FE257_003457 [Aspergillus nanangensis]